MGGASVKLMRLVDDYARTPPRAPKAVVVLVVRLVVVNMAATYAAESCARQWLLGGIVACATCPGRLVARGGPP